MTNRVLYQFPLSLYCEKAAWVLDFKGLGYRCRNMVPGMHLPVAYARAGIPTLPLLRDGQTTVGDSTAIALWLERRQPMPALLPEAPVMREQVLALEGYFDELGDHVRRVVWQLAVDGPQMAQIFWGFAGYGPAVRLLGRCTVPVLRYMLRWRFRLNEADAAVSWQRVTDGLLYVESLLAANGGCYLVGDQFTLADLTGAAMLAPLVGPDNSPWSAQRLGIPMTAERQALRDSPVGQWVLRMYAQHRGTRHDAGHPT